MPRWGCWIIDGTKTKKVQQTTCPGLYGSRHISPGVVNGAAGGLVEGESSSSTQAQPGSQIPGSSRVHQGSNNNNNRLFPDGEDG